VCGLFGLVAQNSTSSEAQQSMIKVIAFRGPDGSEILDLSSEGGPILGHTRLSIIGGESAAQPMWAKNGRFCITFNGEIYNFEQLGLDFGIDTEGSDTRLLIELWNLMGAHSINLLRGQWAFSIWDSWEKVSYLVTDQFGILPLYIHIQQNSICWASSVRVFKAAGLPLTPSSSNLADYMGLRYHFAPKTSFSQVSKIPPGTLVTVSSDFRTSFELWAHDEAETLRPKPVSTKELARTIEQSIELSLRADREVGIFLSGGVDSAVIASVASAKADTRVKAYTAHWTADELQSELKDALESCEHLNIQIVPVEITPSDWWRALEEGAEFRDSPSAEIADPVVYLLSERASKDLKVVLSGEGADELFLGYPKYALENLISNPFARPFVYLALKLMVIIRPESPRLERINLALHSDSKTSRWDLFFSTLPAARANKKSIQKSKILGDTRRQQLRDFQGYLPNVLLERADRNGMANALEIRPSMLNRDLFTKAMRLNPSKQTRLLKTKIDYRKAAELIVGKSIAFRKSRGFPIPLSQWIRKDLKSEFEVVLRLESHTLDSVASPETRVLCLQEHLSGKRDHALLLFTWVSYLIWESQWT